jgi:hypothetical protein
MPALVKPPSISWAEVLKRTWKETHRDDVCGGVPRNSPIISFCGFFHF